MSDAQSSERFLGHAMEREHEHDWLGAIEFYKKSLGLLPESDILKLGEIWERTGYAFYRAAMQAENATQFSERMRQAAENYEKAKEFYGELSGPRRTPVMLRCEAMVAYVHYWLATEVSEKKRVLKECWQKTIEALKAFEQAGEALEYGRMYNQLSSVAYLIHILEWSFKFREKTMKEALDCGELAITLLSSVRDTNELAKAYVNVAVYVTSVGWYFIPDLDEKEKHYQKGFAYWQKANELSVETASLELLTGAENLAWSFDEILAIYEKALDYARKTKDKYLIGNALDYLAYASFWKSMGTEEQEKKMEFGQKALQCAEGVRQLFSSISLMSTRGGVFWSVAPETEYYWEVAQWETNLSRRRDLLEKAVKSGVYAIKLAESTGSHEIILLANHALSTVLGSLAQMETNLDEKRALLEKALEHRKVNISIIEQVNPFTYWNRGVMWNFLAELKAELSSLENDPEKRKNMLQEAILDKERCLQLCIKEILYFEKRGELSLFAVLGKFQYSYGEWLNRLYDFTSDSEHQRKAIDAFEEATESLKKLNLFSRVAECCWKSARSCSVLSEHLRAAEDFNLAAANYNLAAEKIHQLNDFYRDHESYMLAWAEIEKARHHHGRQEYGLSKEHYEKAATMHKSLKQWSYLAPNYSAWAQVENAEDLSRKERSEEGIQAFEEASRLFGETKKSLQSEATKVESADEKQMAINLVRASEQRREYCLGRINLEEAKILDKKGDHFFSSEKYGSAAEIFQKVMNTLESEQDRREFKLIFTLSQAWQKMTRAEAEASPALYLEASQLFENAKEFGPNEKAKMLALGHSRFCRALEAGTKFEDARDTTMYTLVMQHLESAANYYMKAGFQNASEYAKATELLFEAYLRMYDVTKENDPEKKAKLYMVAEKVLLLSADSYMKAEHQEKKDQVLRLLEKVREKREFAVSLTELLHAPSVVSTTFAFATPTPTFERAVGIERFEHADIHANVIFRRKSLKVGENLDLELELVNTGTGPALLTRVEEIVPEGFVLTEKPGTYRMENGNIDMRGKRLDPLKNEEVRLVLKPKVRGVFSIKPKVLYLDENGNHKTHEPEPVTITVKELGISGWIKGP